MASPKKIKNALISVYYKDGLDTIVRELDKLGITIFTTGGTQTFIEGLGIKVQKVEDLTSYPSILGGRVKTLHPKVFGGILSRREEQNDILQLEEYKIPEIDLVIVNLYPFEETVNKGAVEQEIIEKIDIGGVSLIRAAAKNFNDVTILSNKEDYSFLLNILQKEGGVTQLEDRKNLARKAFNITSHYDTAIFNYFNKEQDEIVLKQSVLEHKVLRYGENPHQRGVFFGKLEEMFEQLHGKELSYNNLLDVDAAVSLIAEFKDTTFAILKHNNACGVASRDKLVQAWIGALSADPVSAFGGVLIANKKIDLTTAKEINSLFFEVLIAPAFDEEALSELKQKKNRVLLLQKPVQVKNIQYKTALNGILAQEKDNKTETIAEMKPVTVKIPSQEEFEDLVFANKLVKHTKSNTIVLVKNKQLLASGTGQTSRVDALKQAIAKAKGFGFDLKGAVMASDAFFPFPDCVEIAHLDGVSAVVQPGGSIKDTDSINYCNINSLAMVFTGTRHFKH